MKSDVPDRGLVREYLLGRLDDKKELEEQLSRGICVNDDLSEMVESIEEEIIEDFLDGGLDPADKDAVDGYFLRPPERKEKLRFARVLRDHLELRPDLVNARTETFGSANVRPESIDYRSPHFGHSHLRNYGGLAALVLLTVAGLIYISGIRKNQARLEGQLAQEREQSAIVAKEAQVSQVAQASMVALTLVSDRSRGDSTQIPNIEIKPSAQRIVVEIALPGRSPGPFDVMLEARGKNQPIWAARLLPLVSASGDARLVFDVPAQGVASDVYSFVVSSSLPGSGRPKHYDFRITVAK
jgi:anti-sigma factor RsiW